MIETIGKFIVKEITDEFIQLDPLDKGNETITEKYNDSELNKDIDNLEVGDFVELSGEYEAVKSNDLFTKIEIDNQTISLPNSKVLEVE